MKKLFLLFALIGMFAACTPVTAQTTTTKIENVKQDIAKAIDSTLKDSAAMASIVNEVETAIENVPEKEAGFWTWFAWVFGILYFIAGVVASHYPTKKSMWWLRLLPFIVNTFIIPKDKRKNNM